MALCHHELLLFIDEKSNFYIVLSLNRVILISTVYNLFTMLSAKMYFPSSTIVSIAIFHQELFPLVLKFATICEVYSLTQVISDET